jgi:death-associated protein kinase
MITFCINLFNKSCCKNNLLNKKKTINNIKRPTLKVITKDPGLLFYNNFNGKIDEGIDMGQFKKIDYINKGTFGSVYKIKYNNICYAAKECNKKKYMSWENELMILTKLRNSNYIVHLNSILYTKTIIVYLLDYYNTDLFNYIQQQPKFTESETKEIIKNIMSGIHFLNSKNIAHLDIKPENILLKNNDINTIVLSDFGSAKYIRSKTNYLSIDTGTKYYNSPELDKKIYYNNSDIWNVGIILTILISGDNSFLSGNKQKYSNLLYSSKEMYDSNNKYLLSNEGFQILISMLEYNTYNRPTVEDLMNNEWFGLKLN